MLDGNNIFISLDGRAAPFAATKANEIRVENNIIDISSPTTGAWEDCIAGRNKWSFTVNSLVGNPDDIANLLMVNRTYTISIYSRTTSIEIRLTGTAICQAAVITATRGNLAQGSFTFRGKGPLNPILVQSLIFLQASIDLVAGESYVTPITARILPASATNRTLAWESSDESVAYVHEDGIIDAVEAGTCTVTATTTDGSNLSATCEVNVTEESVE